MPLGDVAAQAAVTAVLPPERRDDVDVVGRVPRGDPPAGVRHRARRSPQPRPWRRPPPPTGRRTGPGRRGGCGPPHARRVPPAAPRAGASTGASRSSARSASVIRPGWRAGHGRSGSRAATWRGSVWRGWTDRGGPQAEGACRLERSHRWSSAQERVAVARLRVLAARESCDAVADDLLDLRSLLRRAGFVPDSVDRLQQPQRPLPVRLPAGRAPRPPSGVRRRQGGRAEGAGQPRHALASATVPASRLKHRTTVSCPDLSAHEPHAPPSPPAQRRRCSAACPSSPLLPPSSTYRPRPATLAPPCLSSPSACVTAMSRCCKGTGLRAPARPAGH